MINGFEEYYEKSEIDIFNKIGDLAEEKGYRVVYFTVKALKSNISDNMDFITNYKDLSEYLDRKINEEKSYGTVHYIHIYKDESQVLSIYYDDADMRAIMLTPYYEVFDFYNDPERFIANEDEDLLLEFVKIKIKL